MKKINDLEFIKLMFNPQDKNFILDHLNNGLSIKQIEDLFTCRPEPRKQCLCLKPRPSDAKPGFEHCRNCDGYIKENN